MTRNRFTLFALAAAAALALSPFADAQQRTPQATSQAGQTVNSAPSAITVAPSGGGLGVGRPVAEDKGLPIQGRDSVSNLPCAIGPTATCLLPGTGGGGGGGGAVTVADGADIALGSINDAAWTGTGSGSLSAVSRYTAAKIEAIRAQLAGTLTVSGTLSVNCLSGCSGGGGGGASAVASAAAPTYTEGATVNLSTDLAGGLRITSTQLAQIVSNTAGPIPAGSSIIGKTSQVDSGGTDATDTTNHALRVNVVTGAATGVAQGSTTAGQTGGLSQCASTTVAPVYTTAKTNPVSCDLNGNTRTLLMNGNVAADLTATVPTAQVGPYASKNVGGVPTMATPVGCTSGSVANAVATCTLAGVGGATTYLTDFTITSSGATAGGIIACTITGAVTSTRTFNIAIPTGATSGVSFVKAYPTWMSASGANTALVISCPAAGTGATALVIDGNGVQL